VHLNLLEHPRTELVSYEANSSPVAEGASYDVLLTPRAGTYRRKTSALTPGRARGRGRTVALLADSFAADGELKVKE
jgi:hypothetical protein